MDGLIKTELLIRLPVLRRGETLEATQLGRRVSGMLDTCC